MRIALLGAGSVANCGDVALGLAVQQAMATAAPRAELVPVAPDMPGNSWNHRWDGLLRVPGDGDVAWARDFDAVVVGGGGLLGLDPALRAFLGPFGVPAAWNGVCSQNAPWWLTGPELRARVCEAAQALAYRSVRNTTSVRFLRGVGFAGPVERVSDVILAWDPPADEVDLRGFGVDPARPTVVISIGGAIDDPRARDYFADLFASLRRLDATLLLLPFGPIYGDVHWVDRARAALPDAVPLPPLPALQAWNLIGRSTLFVGSRLHGVLAAFCRDVPFLAVDEYLSDLTTTSKIRDFLVEQGLEPLWTCPFVSRAPGRRLERVLATTMSFAAGREAARARLRQHYGDMVAALTGRPG